MTPDTLGALQLMIAEFNIETNNVTSLQGREGIRQSWASKSAAEILDCLLANKTRYGARIADAINGIEDETKRLPASIKEALDLAFAQDNEAGDDID